MKINEHTAILTPKVLLVPYSPHHVPTYHSWMQDSDLQKATASEPLTLAQEHQMQQSWRQDGDKLTFITCLAPGHSSDLAEEAARANGIDLRDEPIRIGRGHLDDPLYMIGDVNLFLYDDDDEEDWRLTHDEAKYLLLNEDMKAVIGEIEIMIARKDVQGKGYGREIVLTFLRYIAQRYSGIMREYHGGHGGARKGSHLKYLRVKIDAENTRSIRLFESIGFVKLCEKPNYFGELELRLPWSSAVVGDLEKRLGVVPIYVEYPEC